MSQAQADSHSYSIYQLFVTLKSLEGEECWREPQRVGDQFRRLLAMILFIISLVPEQHHTQKMDRLLLHVTGIGVM